MKRNDDRHNAIAIMNSKMIETDHSIYLNSHSNSIFEIEAGIPFFKDYNGIQKDKDFSLDFDIQYQPN